MAIVVAFLLSCCFHISDQGKVPKTTLKDELEGADKFIKGLPTYGVKDVAKHASSTERVSF